MKKINTPTTRKIVFVVLCVHALLLLLWWGGLSTLGMAAALLLPIMGTTVWFAYQMGCNSAKKKGGYKDSFAGVEPFRMPFRG